MVAGPGREVRPCIRRCVHRRREMPKTEVFPEEVLLAILHKVGQGVRIAEDQTLVRLFDDAATEHPELFGPFKKHPYYPYSDRLMDALQALDLGSAIVRENAATGYFTV